MGGRGSLRLPPPMVERPSSSYKKLLDRVAFWTMYIAWGVGYKIAAYNATSVGVGRKNILFCVCVCGGGGGVCRWCMCRYCCGGGVSKSRSEQAQ